jgi:DNA polymerase III subunit gamma/tau
MAYQVLARKWRPQRFDEVVGQQAVTRTLRNAIGSRRIAQAFVFAGSRGCGKTTTARILARALNCETGPTPDPCGTCDACIEIAQGRDIDVLEIDAASHTGIDNVREVIIAGLSIAPARDRYKIFIIDEVHQLSTASFNALLKSIEEPPAHVVFMMATTELHKIPDTILSRSQVFEFKTIPTKAIGEQLRRIADAEKIDVPDAALALISRSAEGSMRDAQSAFDQVIAFAGQTITIEDVSTVLGLVGRDLLFDLIEAVIDEDGPRAFALADRAVESGHDLKLVCRELSGVVRDIMIVSVDPARAGDSELAEGEQARLVELAKRFSREDLMRAFDVLAKAETDIRAASHPRYHFEMALLRWMHLRKLVPLTELMEQLGGADRSPTAPPRTVPTGGGRIAPPRETSAPQVGSRVAPASGSRIARATEARVAPTRDAPIAPTRDSRIAPAGEASVAPTGASGQALKDALLAEIRTGKKILYELSIACAQRIDVSTDAVTFTFGANQNAARGNLEQSRPWIEAAIQRLAGRRMNLVVVQSAAPAAPASEAAPPAAKPAAASSEKPKTGGRDLQAEAMSSSAVQAMLDVFPAEIRKVEEM